MFSMTFFITFHCEFPVMKIEINLIAKNIKQCFHVFFPWKLSLSELKCLALLMQNHCFIIASPDPFNTSQAPVLFRFFLRFFFHTRWRVEHFILLYHFHQLTNSHLYATLHVLWLSNVFNWTTCNYQTATYLFLDLPVNSLMMEY